MVERLQNYGRNRILKINQKQVQNIPSFKPNLSSKTRKLMNKLDQQKSNFSNIPAQSNITLTHRFTIF